MVVHRPHGPPCIKCKLPGTARVDDYWYRGRTLDGLEGTFPPSYCWEPDPSNYVNVLKSRKHRVEKFAKVLHSMKAQLDGEIDLVEGDIVRDAIQCCREISWR